MAGWCPADGGGGIHCIGGLDGNVPDGLANAVIFFLFFHVILCVQELWGKCAICNCLLYRKYALVGR